MPIRNLREKWVFPDLVEVPGLFQAGIGGSKLVSQTLYQRGYTSLEDALGFLDPDHYVPSPPSDLPDLAAAADRAASAIAKQEPILIWGDFDVDGQTATSLLYSGLTSLGANVSYYIPNRAKESHGISLPVLQAKIKQHKPSLLLTCDTGIDAVEAVQQARQDGLDVIITDHHSLPPLLPNANAIINPNRLEPGHPLATLPGVGVAFKLMEELFQRNELDPSQLLDLVALGIVADVALLQGDTRYLLQRGLDALRESKRLGLQKLAALSKIRLDEITEDQIGFGIAPRLNALGRLADANPAVEFLTTQDGALAAQLAHSLDDLNQKRQTLTETIFQEALENCDRNPYLLDDFPILVLLGPPSWDPGVIGIVASRLVDYFHRPVIMLSEDGDKARGSARSIPGVHITQLIAAAKDLLISYGGHPMAAGMNLPLANVSEFRHSLANAFSRQVGSLPDELLVQIDGELQFPEINPDFIRDFQRLAPFGAGNPRLVFATRGLSVVKDSKIGKKQNHRKLTLAAPTGAKRDLLWWNSANDLIPEPPLDAAYTLDLNSFNDQIQVQATLEHIRHSPSSPIYLDQADLPRWIDFRNIPDPVETLHSFWEETKGVIWAETNPPAGVPTFPRLDLTENDVLIIWTLPPDRLALQQAISRVNPSQIALFSIYPRYTSQAAFLEGLHGLLKHLQSTRKQFSAARFAQALGLPVDLVEVGLEWIRLKGDYDPRVFGLATENRTGYESSSLSLDEIDTVMKRMLQEAAAFRNYLANTSINAIL